MELKKLINLFTEQTTQTSTQPVNLGAFDTGAFENLPPSTNRPKPAGPRQGVVGSELSKISSGQFTSRADRLNQAKVDAALGGTVNPATGKPYVAGTAAANTALRNLYRQGGPKPSTAPAPELQNKPDADAAAKQDVFKPTPDEDSIAARGSVDAMAGSQATADSTQSSSYGGQDIRTANARAATDAPPAQGFAGDATTAKPAPVQAAAQKGVFSNPTMGTGSSATTQTAPADSAPAKTYGAGYDPNKVQYAVDQPKNDPQAVKGGFGQPTNIRTDSPDEIAKRGPMGMRLPEAELEEDNELSELMRLSGRPMQEKAPPGAKAERMVKHIKKGYAKDGKLSDKEKSIAFATAWKAKKAGKLEEGLNMMLDEEGHTLNHIVNRFKHEVKAFLDGDYMAENLYDALYDYYLDRGEMPYGVAKAREGDPYTWVSARFEADIDGTADVKVPLGEMGHDDTLNELARLAGLSESRVDECGDMGMDRRDTINVSTNMSSDGNKSVNISAQGEKAEELLSMLKLAGMDGQSMNRPAIVAISSDDEMMEEERDTEYSNTPEEEYQSVASITRQGNDLNREKRQYANKPRLGDNPMAEGQMEFDRDLVELLDSVLIKKDMEEGSIKKGGETDLTGTWSSDPPKKGQPDIPPPVPMDPVYPAEKPKAPSTPKAPVVAPGMKR